MLVLKLMGLLAVLATAALFDHSAAASQCPSPKSKSTEFGLNTTIDKQLSVASPDQTISFSVFGQKVRYGRLLFAPSTLDSGWKIIIRDQRLRPLQVIDHRNFAEGTKATWSNRLPTSIAYVSLVLEKDMPELVIDLPVATSMPETAKNPYYSIKGNDPDWADLYSSSFDRISPQVRTLGDSVGMFTSFTGSSFDGVPTWCCSGSIISTEPTTLFLTNFHCGGPWYWTDEQYWKDDICHNTIVDMSWDGDDVSMEYYCKRVVKTDRELDAAVLEIVPLAMNAPLAAPIIVRTDAPLSGEAVQMIHHPRCLSKRISQTCTVGTTLPNWKDSSKKTDFAHRCDTAGGSSGAPIFDKNGNLLGLHHIGYELDKEGQCDNRNKAVISQKLLKFIQDFPGVTTTSD